MRKRNQKKDNDFFIETIDLTPSNNINVQPQNTNSYPTPTYEQDTGFEEHIAQKRMLKKIFKKGKNSIIKVISILLCLYTLFLIYGAIKTNYYIDSETGTRQPIFVTYSDVAKKEDYMTLKKELERFRELLIKVRIVEIKYNNKEIDDYTASVEYGKVLKELDVIIPKVKAMNVKSSQESIKNAFVATYTGTFAAYLQEMQKALEQKSTDALNTALKNREMTFQNYTFIEDSLETLATKLKLQDDFFNWDLDKATAEKDPTAILKNN